jgi:hypothetical protein
MQDCACVRSLDATNWQPQWKPIVKELAALNTQGAPNAELAAKVLESQTSTGPPNHRHQLLEVMPCTTVANRQGLCRALAYKIWNALQDELMESAVAMTAPFQTSART